MESSSDDLKLDYPHFMVMTGAPGQGKTTGAQFFIMLGCELKKWKYGVVINPSEELNNNYSRFLPRERVHTQWDPDIITGFILFQKKMSVENGGNPPPAFFVADDGLGTIPWGHKVWTELAGISRQLNCTLIVITQWANKIPLLFKETARYFAMFDPVFSKSSKEATYNMCGSIHFESSNRWKDFCIVRREKNTFLLHDRQTEETDVNKAYKKCKIVNTPENPMILSTIKF